MAVDRWNFSFLQDTKAGSIGFQSNSQGGSVPESKPRKRPARQAQQTSAAQQNKPNPVWYKPVMFGLMIIGLIWIITFYITEGRFPVQDWASWNIVAGFGIAIVGFLMTTRWRA